MPVGPLLAQVFERKGPGGETCAFIADKSNWQFFIFRLINYFLGKISAMSTKYKILSQDHPYFITFSTIYWIDVFSRKEYRDMLIESLKFCQQQKGLELFAYCIMTNHLHLIARTTEGKNLSNLLRDLKKFTASEIYRRIKNNPQESRKEWMTWMFERAGKKNSNNTNFQFWQQDNHPIELNTHVLMDQKLEYIHMNPVTAGIVLSPEDYLYSSARNYAGLPEVLLDVNFID